MANRKPYMTYRMVPFSMTRYQGHTILWRWIPQKRCEIQT